MKNLFISLVTIVAALAAFAERQPLERYQTIIDRQMFGPPPEGFDPTKRPSEAVNARDARREEQQLTKEQEKLKSSIRFSMINVTPAGETAVGFTDSSDAKNPKNYYLRVGESRDGWTVREADPVASSMTIVKGDVEISLTIGGDSGKGAGKTAAANASRAPDRSGAPAAGGGLGSLRRARREQRRAEETARTEELNRKLQEQKDAFERQRQEERQAREEEKAQQKAEREEQRKQLLQIQDELRRAREEKEKQKEQEREKEDNEDASDT